STPEEVAAAIRGNATVNALSNVPSGTANRLLFAPRHCVVTTTTTTTTTTLPIDADGDGEPRGQDCDDSNPNVHHGATEICGNGLDDDCVGGDLPCPPPPPVGLCYLECW